MPPEASLQLPRDMRQLELGCLDFSRSDFPAWVTGLPSGLTSLHLHVKHIQSDLYFSLGTLPALLFLTITVVEPPLDGGWARHLDFPSLPRSLTKFKLLHRTDVPVPSDITSDTFIGAPRHLRTIHIPDSPLLSVDCLVHLPSLLSLVFKPSDISDMGLRILSPSFTVNSLKRNQTCVNFHPNQTKKRALKVQMASFIAFFKYNRMREGC